MDYYEVLVGNHYEADGTRYRKGDIVESERPLDKIFKAKFLKRDSYSGQERGKKNPPPNPDPSLKDIILKEYKPEELVAVHKGGGRYQVFCAEKDAPVHEGYLSKTDAYDIAGGEPSGDEE